METKHPLNQLSIEQTRLMQLKVYWSFLTQVRNVVCKKILFEYCIRDELNNDKIGEINSVRGLLKPKNTGRKSLILYNRSLTKNTLSPNHKTQLVKTELDIRPMFLTCKKQLRYLIMKENFLYPLTGGQQKTICSVMCTYFLWSLVLSKYMTSHQLFKSALYLCDSIKLTLFYLYQIWVHYGCIDFIYKDQMV